MYYKQPTISIKRILGDDEKGGRMIIDQNGRQILDVAYRNEDVLQEVLFRHPELLANEGEALYSIKREVNTGAGPVDVLMISEAGDVVVVEAKLRRNGQSRREVVAQIIDYISTFSQYSYHSLDALTNNELSRIVDENKNAAELPKKIDDRLRHGAINLIIAVDEINDDLRRIMDFLAEHSDFNVSLIEVKQHKNLDDSIFYSSSIIVKSKGKVLGTPSGGINYNMEHVCQQWDYLHQDKKVRGSGARFRQIKIKGWPLSVHYEFYHNDGAPDFKVRLDNEIEDEEARKKVSDVLRKFDGYALNDKYAIKAVVSPKNDTVMHLQVVVNVKNIDDVVEVMDLLMQATEDKIAKVVLE